MRQRRSRVCALLLPLVLLAGVMGACGDDDDEESGGGTTTTAVPAAPAGSAKVDIEMKDYSYAVSGALIEGGTINLTNTGKELHMMGIAKLKPGASVGDVVTAFTAGGPTGGEEEGEEEDEGDDTTTSSSGPGGGAPTSTTSTTAAGGDSGDRGQEPGDEEGEEDPSAAFIEKELGLPGGLLLPGGKVEITVPTLAGPGRYALACFIPTEGDGAPHVVKGMATQLEVMAGTVPPPQADATYVAAAGRAIEGPVSLSPGKHVLKIEATGAGASELEPAMAKPKANTSLQDIADAFEAAFGDDAEAPPAKGAAANIPLDGFVNLFDFEEADAVYLGVDLTPGTWEMVANDTDAEEALDVPVERITIKVG